MADVDDLGFCLGGFSLSWPMFGGAPVQEWAFCSLLSADAQSARPSSEKSDLCGIQPLVWVVLTKLQNSLARSNRSRFG